MKFGIFKSLSLRKEIRKLNFQGFFLKRHYFNVKFIQNHENKAMFIIRKKIGNSPTRNNIKRRLRSVLSIQEPNLKKIHIMIIVKNEFLSLNFLQIKKEIGSVFDKIFAKIDK